MHKTRMTTATMFNLSARFKFNFINVKQIKDTVIPSVLLNFYFKIRKNKKRDKKNNSDI